MNTTYLTKPESYHAIIGLAGHVDHGKTTLIEALTGIMTSRPHEQKLGMTQDLGFAHFADDNGNMIGVIDVPGHERYLRNMVAGVWHINVLLLVVSAEEGCMPMTLMHTLVARAMGVRHIVVCLSKSDKVSDDQLAETEEEVLETIMDVSGLVPEIISVSAVTGNNITELKNLLTQQAKLSTAGKTDAARPPFMYVDRVFVVNGIGTVVTGTLAAGTLKIGDKLHCAPGGVTGTVRSIQAYHRQVDTVFATSRVAINMKGLNRKQVRRGSLLFAPDAPVTLQTQCIVRVRQFDLTGEASFPGRNKVVEVASGSWHGEAHYIPLPDSDLARLVFSQSVPVYFGQRMAIIPDINRSMVIQGEVLWCDFIPKHRKRQIYEHLQCLPKVLAPQSQLDVLLKLQGFYPMALNDSASPVSVADEQIQLGDYIVASEWLETIKQSVINRLAPGQTYSTAELAYAVKADETICAEILKLLKNAGQIHLKFGKWHAGEGSSEDDLPPPAMAILNQARSLGKDGLETNKTDLGKDKKWLRQLVHQKYLVAIDQQIYFDGGVYLDLVKSVIADHQPEDTISLQEIKLIVQLSRKYLIPFVNKMEKDGWLRRQEDTRIILKAWPV